MENPAHERAQRKIRIIAQWDRALKIDLQKLGSMNSANYSVVGISFGNLSKRSKIEIKTAWRINTAPCA